MEFVCAPKITHSQIAFLYQFLDEYMQLISSNFSDVKLRPKHHYVLHYPGLILQFGPLIWLWTLRFESKHRYFKSVLKACHNFVNVTLQLAYSH